jgi:23S rRNA (cytosine1962-C5)-methyltransferase
MTAGLVLRLKRGHDHPRVHPWIFKGDVADVSDVRPGAAVTVVDGAGRFVGRGFYNPRPALCCRILTRRDEPLDAPFFGRRLEAALAFRARLAAAAAESARGAGGAGLAAAPTAGRLVWSEADALPGLVVDRYGETLVVQCQTLGMAAVRATVVAELRARLGPVPVLDADEDAPAALEGFAPARGWRDRPGPETIAIAEGPVRLRVAPGTGHKTGLYLDQAENRRRIAALAPRGAMLDAFSYTAGFACHALAAGASRALCLESAPEAIAGARANLELNGMGARAEVRPGNAFDELRRLERAGDRFGLVVLDPPPFARSRATLEAAGRGYKEINLRAMRLVATGGYLMTFSCSHHVSPSLFEEICRAAAADAATALRVLGHLGPAPDHPVLLAIPETRYLTGLLLQRIDH